MSKPIDRTKLRGWYGELQPGMRLADIHLHTRQSDGWWRVEALAEAAVDRGLNAVAITDHDDINSGLAMREYVARRGLPLVVYPGAEISARRTGRDVHVLGIGLSEPVRPWMNIEATIEAIVAQGGVPILPHGKADPARSPNFPELLNLPLPVSVEIYNAATDDFRLGARRRGENNDLVRLFYEEHQQHFLGAVGGTDGHLRTVGRGLTGYDGDLLNAIRERRTVVLIEPSPEEYRPWDAIGYVVGLKRMARRRRRIWGPDRPDG